jgi:hypothetical protein
MARRTFTLSEVAEDCLPPTWTDGARWLARRLNKGELRGVRIGRTWMMRDSDITLMLEKFSNAPAVEPAAAAPVAAATFTDAQSPRSRARLRRVQ